MQITSEITVTSDAEKLKNLFRFSAISWSLIGLWIILMTVVYFDRLNYLNVFTTGLILGTIIIRIKVESDNYSHYKKLHDEQKTMEEIVTNFVETGITPEETQKLL